jgi:3-oxoacyl-[acyl-carrier-protein] synthase II
MPQKGDSRVVITGFGLITPIGTGVDAFWDSLRSGRAGIRRITQFDPAPLTSQIAGEVPDFDPAQYINRKEARRMSRASQFAVAAAQLAVQDAGLTIDDSNREDIGVLIASGASSPSESEAMVRDYDRGGFGKINPFHVTGSLPTCRPVRWRSISASSATPTPSAPPAPPGHRPSANRPRSSGAAMPW